MSKERISRFEPRLAPVRPRAFSPGRDAIVPLESLVRPWVEGDEAGEIWIGGARCSGKTTALQHLAAVFADFDGLYFRDEAALQVSRDAKLRADRARLVFSSAGQEPCRKGLAAYRLAPWGQDEAIEYLLHEHRDRCNSVMRRLQALDTSELGGAPELWRVVLDQMAEVETPRSVSEALENYVDGVVASPDVRWKLTRLALERLELLRPRTNSEAGLRAVTSDERMIRMARYRPIQMLSAAKYIIGHLEQASRAKWFDRPIPIELVREVGRRAARDPKHLGVLQKLFNRGSRQRQPQFAEILHATGTGWAPRTRRLHSLANARLAGACWPGIRLSKTSLIGCDFTGADLHDAKLDQLAAHQACFRGANLKGADLNRIRALAAVFEDADLSRAHGVEADLSDGRLQRAVLEGACLPSADFSGASLSGARFARADLSFAVLAGAEIGGADFRGAKLEHARLQGLDLTSASFSGAVFEGASLDGCVLEGMSLPAARFKDASLRAALLTGAFMPSSDFRNANLSGAGLADVNWERADLRFANLSNATFQMGSSRSGRLDSPIACEGSRTGFYTDEYLDCSFRSPEEIRKANLCGADLRGAQISKVDFYLVDLRGAHYTPEQEKHLRRCRAILEMPVPD